MASALRPSIPLGKQSLAYSYSSSTATFIFSVIFSAKSFVRIPFSSANIVLISSDPTFTTEGTDNIKKFVNDLIGFYVIMEGIFFYAGFVMMLSMLRQHKMVGVGEQFQFILRDESIHLAFGSELINTIFAEEKGILTKDFAEKITENIKTAVELEYEYAKDCLPKGILGLNADTIYEYLQYIADRRLERIGLKKVYESKNPFPWMSEIIDLRKEKNFFETRVNEYKIGSLSWD